MKIIETSNLPQSVRDHLRMFESYHLPRIVDNGAHRKAVALENAGERERAAEQYRRAYGR